VPLKPANSVPPNPVAQVWRNAKFNFTHQMLNSKKDTVNRFTIPIVKQESIHILSEIYQF